MNAPSPFLMGSFHCVAERSWSWTAPDGKIVPLGFLGQVISVLSKVVSVLGADSLIAVPVVRRLPLPLPHVHLRRSSTLARCCPTGMSHTLVVQPQPTHPERPRRWCPWWGSPRTLRTRRPES